MRRTVLDLFNFLNEAVSVSTVTIIVRNAAGDGRPVSGNVGDSLMKALVSAGVEGIDAECGGECSCATCHVILSDEWNAHVAPAGELEADMLEFASSERQAGSRLSCQVLLAEGHEGFGIVVAET